MGANNSREDRNKQPALAGFTPLTPLKRPGSIRAAPHRNRADSNVSTSASAVPSIPEQQETDESSFDSSAIDSSAAKSQPHSVCGEVAQVQSSNSGNEPDVTPDSVPEEQVELKEVPASDVNEGESSRSSSNLDKPVYGAAYPPEMAEIMMKQYNAAMTTTTFSLGGLRIGSGFMHESQHDTVQADISSLSDDRARSSAYVEEAGNRSRAKFEKVLEEETVNLNELQALCWSGCPPEHRANTWRLLLRYMPANADRRTTKMNTLRAEYADAVVKYFKTYDPSTASQYDRTMYNQIAVDLPRTNPSMPLFQNEVVQQCIHRILYVWAIRHPGTGYVQGINDLVTPFFYLFLKEATGATEQQVSEGTVMEQWGSAGARLNSERLDQVEADCYHCLTNLLDTAQDNYVFDNKGIQEKVFILRRIIARLDDKLVAHLDRMEVEFLQFAFRWFNCLLMREFSLQRLSKEFAVRGTPHLATIPFTAADVIGLQRVIIGLQLELPMPQRVQRGIVPSRFTERAFASFHVYVCAAVLLSFSKQLQEMDFQEMMLFLQKLPTHSWDETKMGMIVAQAYAWSQQLSPSHL